MLQLPRHSNSPVTATALKTLTKPAERRSAILMDQQSQAVAHLGAHSQPSLGRSPRLSCALFDRMPRGVMLTMHGAGLLRDGQAAFDEPRLGAEGIEALVDSSCTCSKPARMYLDLPHSMGRECQENRGLVW